MTTSTRRRPLPARTALALVALALCACAAPSREARPERVRVMAFNLWHGGDAGRVGVAGLAEVVRVGGADLVGVQESHGFPPREGEPRPDRSIALARVLGMEHVALEGRRAVLSRWPILERSPRGHGVLVDAPGGPLAVFSLHLAHAPYQPYQLVGIEYHGGAFLVTEAEAVTAARAARGDQVADVLVDLATSGWDAPTFVVGDFNEPSHLDWTERAAAAGLVPLAVAWPSSTAFEAAGFVDAWRATHPDEVAAPGRTWTPLTSPDDPADRHDRIDLVLVRGGGGRAARVASAFVVGEARDFADLVVTPFPSDHRAVVAEVELLRGGAPGP